MELKTARLTLLIDPHKMIRDYLLEHGVGYTPSGLDAPTAPAAVQPPAPKRRATAARPAAGATAPNKARRKA